MRASRSATDKTSAELWPLRLPSVQSAASARFGAARSEKYTCCRGRPCEAEPHRAACAIGRAGGASQVDYGNRASSARSDPMSEAQSV